ncbi:Hpt domain-containing protein [Pseudaeromonas sharmana]|uniref:Hpt domain-containing protein n=1 Tax=Pseudaeromonas sharmana TaxID=328412 RepID=A0ABV8CRM4_9GAMM
MQWIDQQIIDQLGQDAGYEILPQLVTIFVEDSEQALLEMEKALSSQDAETLSLLAHTLKSVCATYGANQSHLEAKALEMACRQQRWDSIRQYLAALQYSVPQSSLSLQRFIAEQSMLSH